MAQAVQLVQPLEPPDAIVYASVEKMLTELDPADPKAFVTKNSKDFATPSIEETRSRFNCRLITSFSGAREYIENELNKPLR